MNKEEPVQTEDKMNLETVEMSEEANEAESDDQLQIIESLQVELEESKNKYIYLAAELENTGRRFEKERENLLKYGNEKILKEMLEVVDNFERSVDTMRSDTDEKVKNIVIGIDMVKKQLLDSLKKFGLEEIKALGEIFDPNFHEALAQEKSEKAKENEIIKEYQKGYILNGRLLRASKVVVTSK